MHATRTTARQQHNRIATYRANCDSYSIFNLLTSDTLLDKVEELMPDVHRERLYPPTETLSMFLTQAMSADRSCQHIVNQAALQRLAGGLSVGSTATGGYCLARQRLPQTMVSTLTQHLGAVKEKQGIHKIPAKYSIGYGTDKHYQLVGAVYFAGEPTRPIMHMLDIYQI